MRELLSYIFYGVSELSQCRLSPTLATAHYSCPDNAIELVGRQLGRHFLNTSSVYVNQTLFLIIIN